MRGQQGKLRKMWPHMLIHVTRQNEITSVVEVKRLVKKKNTQQLLATGGLCKVLAEEVEKVNTLSATRRPERELRCGAEAKPV